MYTSYNSAWNFRPKRQTKPNRHKCSEDFDRRVKRKKRIYICLQNNYRWSIRDFIQLIRIFIYSVLADYWNIQTDNALTKPAIAALYCKQGLLWRINTTTMVKWRLDNSTFSRVFPNCWSLFTRLKMYIALYIIIIHINKKLLFNEIFLVSFYLFFFFVRITTKALANGHLCE